MKNLYDFWGDKIYRELVDESHIILNLASKEYSRCIEKYLTEQDTFISCIFGEYVKGKVVQKGIYAKMARGEMVRYMAEHHVEDLEEIKNFHQLDFSYEESLSTDTRFVFIKKS